MQRCENLDKKILNQLPLFTPNGLLLINKNGEIVFYNSNVSNLLSLDMDNCSIKLIEDIIPNFNIIKKKYSFNTQSSLIEEFEYNDIKLHYKIFQMVDSKDEEVTGIILLNLHDIIKVHNELKSAKHTMEELEEILEGSWDGILVTDGDGNVLYVNSSYERVAAIKVEELKNKNMRDLINPVWMKNSVAFVVRDTKKTVSKAQVTKDGRDIIVTGTPIFDEEGNIKKIVINARDITEIYRLREELTKSKEHELRYYENILDTANEELPSKAIAVSEEMQNVFSVASKVGNFDATVLILGESGAGKEEVAKHIHSNSLRKNKPFITINCGAIPYNLLESELFGYQKGAFTGANTEGKKGLFEMADSGTIFLDEIGDLPLDFQVKILRVIENKEIMKIGALKSQSVDVRIIAATNRNLLQMVHEGKFREDLYYRLNIVQLIVPPLRDRRDDILPLSIYFLKTFNVKYNQKKRLTPEVIKRLINYSWPGNVRQLRNVIESMVVVSYNDYLQVSDLPWVECEPRTDEILLNEFDELESIPLDKVVADFEKDILQKAKDKYGSTREIGKYLHIDQSTVVRKMKKYGI